MSLLLRLLAATTVWRGGERLLLGKEGKHTAPQAHEHHGEPVPSLVVALVDVTCDRNTKKSWERLDRLDKTPSARERLLFDDAVAECLGHITVTPKEDSIQPAEHNVPVETLHAVQGHQRDASWK